MQSLLDHLLTLCYAGNVPRKNAANRLPDIGDLEVHENTPQEKAEVAAKVARYAKDPTDKKELMEMLGLI